MVHVKCKFTQSLQTEVGPKFGFYRDPALFAWFLKVFYEEAGIPPHVVEYVEAFGSGKHRERYAVDNKIVIE